MKRRVAIPVYNGRLSEFFGGCSHYEVYDAGRRISGKNELHVPAGTAVSDLPSWLASNGVTDVIAYKADREIVREFALRKINLFMGVAVDTPENLLEAYRQGWLESDATIIRELTQPTGKGVE